MPQKASILVTKAVYSQLSNADTTTATIQVIGPGNVYLQGLVGVGTPDDVGAFLFTPTSGEKLVVLAELFPDIPTANRLYARAESIDTMVVIRHG